MGRIQGQIKVASGSVVDLIRVVDLLVDDVRIDMDEMTAIGLSVIRTLSGLSYPTRHWIWA